MAALMPFRDINVHASSSQYSFTSPSSSSSPTLVVDRPSGDLRLNDGSLLGGKRVSSIAGILGIIKLRLGKQAYRTRMMSQADRVEDKYIIVITKAQPMGRLKGHMVYRVVATEFLPLRERPLHDPDEDNYLSLLKTLLKTGPMYFSYSFDLTNTFQRQSQTDLDLPLWKRADDRFFWNRFIQTDLIDCRTRGATGLGDSRQSDRQQPGVDPFILPVMFGMMRITTTAVKGTPLTFVLITRRSRHRAGTRYFSRGIDERGNVSNFNETEQAIILNDSTGGLGGFAGGGGMQNGRVGGHVGGEVQVISYVQTRGSVPVYWAEVNTLHYTPKLQIRGVDSAINAAKEHFDEQIRLYGDNYLVNLVNQKGREEKVKNAYEQMVKALTSSPSENTRTDSISPEAIHVVEQRRPHQQLDRLHYIYFDFHNETKGLRWHRAQLLLDQLGDALANQGYFRGVDMPADAAGRLEVRNQQMSVVRTNCMDCLDRTNLVQSMLARWHLNRALTDLGILHQGESAYDDIDFEILFRNVWADNADVVSKSYSGTGALKTDFTRTGQRTKAGMLQDLRNSVTRYVKNNFDDGPRQDGFDLFLGAHFPSTSSTGTTRIFIDRRPILIQSIPYLLAASVFMVLIATFTRRLPDAAILPLRIFVVVWFAVGLWCLRFIYTHGMLYVNWPKLNPLPWALEGYNDTIASVRKDKIVGPWIGKRKRGDAVAALNTLQSNSSIVEAIRKSGKGMNQYAIPEMIEWCRKTGYEPVDFDRLRAIHIAGTKGKGSTSAFISSILAQYLPSSTQHSPKLHKIGLYTSPHLRFVRERICINNKPLSEEEFAKYFFSTWKRLEATAQKAGLPTDVSAKPVYFRFLTLMALHAYIEENVDTAVIEAGVGGEYDSTNILVHPTVAGITSLGIDHVAMLGGTIEEIAWHKAGIMKSGTSVFTVPQLPGAMKVLEQRAAEKGIRLQVIDRHPSLDSITLGLAADFQKTNASLAIAIAATHLRCLGHTDIPAEIWNSPELPPEFQRGLEQAQCRGRCETRREKNIVWCLDGGHTLESIELSAGWFASKILPSSSSSPISDKPEKSQPRVLIFNQQNRDAGALARALHRTLTQAMQDKIPFTHVIFCSNITFKEGGYKADLVSINSNEVDVAALSVQWALKKTWEDIEDSEVTAENKASEQQNGAVNGETGRQRRRAEVMVVKTIEEAVEKVRDLAQQTSGDDTTTQHASREIPAEAAVVGSEDIMCLITGSVHLVGGALEVLESRKGSR
ncbi:MAG: hypothetical protein M1837_002428 [Sclerophora amabilis]|nr:MAG: hypothetical protein M1837_002428 [Sclerophora amabilis]